MNEHEVSASRHLDAKLAINAMRKHQHLWRVAEGRVGWFEGIAMLLPILLIGVGIFQLARDDALAELLGESGFIIMGVVLFASYMTTHRERQLNALLEIVRRLERDRR